MFNNKKFWFLIITGGMISLGINLLIQYYANTSVWLHCLLIVGVAFCIIYTLLELFSNWWQE